MPWNTASSCGTPKNAEAVTEITYEPWHWRYVGPENAALIQQSGLCFEDAVAVLQKLAAGKDHRLKSVNRGLFVAFCTQLW